MLQMSFTEYSRKLPHCSRIRAGLPYGGPRLPPGMPSGRGGYAPRDGGMAPERAPGQPALTRFQQMRLQRRNEMIALAKSGASPVWLLQLTFAFSAV